MGTAARAVKDGRAHLAALDIDRSVSLDGELITRVAEHPAFAESCKAMTAWAELHAGFMGRSPDHPACAVSGQLMALDLFEEHNPRCAKA